jgi:formate hydrogenlyase subunit 6/NADH:ubiquinone oxidoreductase subunit I/DNA-binding transcriptional ArsR family regulator
MGHLTFAKEEVYKALANRLDKNPVGAPLNETLLQILKIMYTEKEAEIGSKFPAGFSTADRLAEISGLSREEITAHLEEMAVKGLVIDSPRGTETFYLLSPLVVGFFEYTFMRTDGRLPLKELAELFERYHHEPGVTEEFFGAETKIFRTWTYESQLPVEVHTEVLDYEKASAIIRASGGGALGTCYCRHQALHRGKACDAPLTDVCTSLGNASEWLIRRKFARPATVDELLRVLEKTEKLGLVHLVDNVRNNPAFLCHCCGCCCGPLRSIRDHGIYSVHPGNFIPKIDSGNCTCCGSCLERCQIRAIELVTTPDGEKTTVLEDRCLGCGACVSACPSAALSLRQRTVLHLPPKDKKEQMLRIAQEKGKI